MEQIRFHKAVGVRVGRVQVGGGAPIVVQSMTMTDTADAAGTATQCIELAEAGSEMVRVTVNVPEAAAAVPEIKQRMLDAGARARSSATSTGNATSLTKFPRAPRRSIAPHQPGKRRHGRATDERSPTICSGHGSREACADWRNGGSLNQELS